MKKKNYICAIILFLIMIIVSCAKKDNETEIEEPTPEYMILPDFETLESYIGRSDTISVFTELRQKGYMITNNGGLIYATKELSNECTGEYIFYWINNKITTSIYRYSNMSNTNHLDNKNAFMHVFNNGINTFMDNCYIFDFYGEYYIGDQCYEVKNWKKFQEQLELLDNNQFVKGVNTIIYFYFRNVKSVWDFYIKIGTYNNYIEYGYYNI